MRQPSGNTAQEEDKVELANRGLAISSTAYYALLYAQDPTAKPPDMGHVLVALKCGLAMIRDSVDSSAQPAADVPRVDEPA